MHTQIQQKNAFPSSGLDSYFFTTPALRLRLDLIQERICSGETPVLIVGESGAGKSTLLNQLVIRADHYWRVIRVPAVTSFSASEIITFLSAELRLPCQVSTEEMLRELDRWLDRLAVRGQIAVVVVDNAHELSDESLTTLATLPGQMQSQNLRVLLTGESSLRTRLSGLLGNSRSSIPIHVFDIPCLDQREVASYIDMRLYYAGLEGRGPFSRATIDDIARSARGHPGRINAMANELLNGERKGAQWRRASELLRRIMRHWLTLTVMAGSVAIASMVVPGSGGMVSEGHAATYSPSAPLAKRNQRSIKKTEKPAHFDRTGRALLLLREILPGLWRNGR